MQRAFLRQSEMTRYTATTKFACLHLKAVFCEGYVGRQDNIKIWIRAHREN